MNKLSLIIFSLLLIGFVYSDNESTSKFYEKIHSFKLEGNSTLAYYYTSIYVGTPPQRQTVIVDTGSYLLGFPCQDCGGSNCGKHIDKPFDYSLSTTVENIGCKEKVGEWTCQNCNQGTKQCEWSISYAEGSSLKGHVMSDYVVMGDYLDHYVKDSYKNADINFAKYLNQERVRIPFGCTVRETNLFLSQAADGILGLSPKTNTYSKMPNVVDSLYKNHKNNGEHLVFSLCLGMDGGYISIGGYNHNLHEKGAVTRVIPYKNTGMYTINLHNITVGGQNIGIQKSQISNVVVDSGTTLMFGPSSVINAMNSFIENTCQKPGNCDGKLEKERNQYCFRRDPKKHKNLKSFFDTFPIIEFQLDNEFQFQWYPEQYFFLDGMKKNNENLYCFGFEASGGKILLGGTWMRQYDMLFDRENENIHFTRSECNSDSLSENHIEEIGNQQETKNDDEILYSEMQKEIEQFIQKLSNTNQEGKGGNMLASNDLIDSPQEFNKYAKAFAIVFFLAIFVTIGVVFIKKSWTIYKRYRQAQQLEQHDTTQGEDQIQLQNRSMMVTLEDNQDSRIMNIDDKDEDLTKEDDDEYGNDDIDIHDTEENQDIKEFAMM